MKFLLFCFIMGLTFICPAQVVVQSNNSAVYNSGGAAFPFTGVTPVNNARYVELKEGTPFFQDSWTASKIVSVDGKVVEPVTVKLNLLDNKVHYKDSAGRELVIGTPLREVHLQGTSNNLFVNGDVLPNPKTGWYMLLVNDTLTLLKGFKKTFEQHTSYGAPTEYSIKTVETYLVYLKDQEFEVRKLSDFSKVLPSKKSEIEQEIKKLDGKRSKDEQFAALAIRCNELLKK